jgi:hypothetical protein
MESIPAEAAARFVVVVRRFRRAVRLRDDERRVLFTSAPHPKRFRRYSQSFSSRFADSRNSPAATK